MQAPMLHPRPIKLATLEKKSVYLLLKLFSAVGEGTFKTEEE